MVSTVTAKSISSPRSGFMRCPIAVFSASASPFERFAASASSSTLDDAPGFRFPSHRIEPGIDTPGAVAIVARSFARGFASFDFGRVAAAAAFVSGVTDGASDEAAASGRPATPPRAALTDSSPVASAIAAVAAARCFAIASFMNASFARNASRFSCLLRCTVFACPCF